MAAKVKRRKMAPGHVTPERVQVAIRGRFNPIRSLTPELLSRQLDAFKVGFLRDLAVLWEAMERRDLTLKNVAGKRKKAVARQNWEVITVPGADEAEAERQAEALKYFYENLTATDVLNQNERGTFSLLVRQMMDAVGKQFAVHEIVMQPARGRDDGFATAEFRFVPLWFFENTTGRLRFIPSEGAIYGVELEEDGWLVTVGEGLMEASSVAYMFKHMPLKDWLAYSEKFGMPGVLGKTDAAKDTPEWNAMEEAVKSLINDWAAVCNRSSEITLLETKGGASSLPMPPLVDYFDRAMASLWRGADLSTMSAKGNADSTGASLQNDEADILLADDTQMINDTLNMQVDPLVLRWNFGEGVEPLAYVRVIGPKKQNVEQDIAIDTFLRESGAPLGKEATLERYGRAVPDDEDELLTAPNQSVPHPDPLPEGEGKAKLANTFQTAARDELARALADDLRPLRERLGKILEIEDAGIMREKLAGFMIELPRLLKDISADPQSARVLEGIIAASMINGMEEAKV